MSMQPKVRIGTSDWFEENPERIAIYNSNYTGNFIKHFDFGKPWCINTRASEPDWDGKRFETYEAAATFVRDEVLKK